MRKSILLILLTMAIEAHAGGCYKARIIDPPTFLGNSDEQIQLFDGTMWEIKYAYENLGLQYPMATICPKSNTLIVAGIKFYVIPLQFD